MPEQMQKLHDLIVKNENRLLKLVLQYAKEHNYVVYTSTLEEAWRMSIVGLSASITAALQTSARVPELPVDHDFSNDPIAAYGTLEAKRHRQRGVSFKMFLGLMKYYRQSYIDLVCEANFEKAYRDWSLLFINRVFDRIEIGFSAEWLESVEGKLVAELQDSNRSLTNEKNSYLTIFESLPTPVIFLNKDNTIKNLNFAASQLLQFSGTSGGYYYRESGPSATFSWFDSELKAFSGSGDSEFIFEKSITLKNEVKHFEVKLARMLDVSEKFSGIVIILNDISDRKKMEDLRYLSSQKEWEDTFDTITDMITIHDRDFNVLRANNAARKFLKLSRATESATKCYELFHGTSCPPDRCVGRECLETGKAVSLETLELHLGMFLEIRAIPKLDSNNEIAGVIHVVRDITERKRLEEQLRESHKMEAIGHLAGGIAHDFNNLLTAIKGPGYLIRKKLPEDDSLMPFIEQILDVTDRATTLIQGLLAYSRKQIITTTPVDLNQIILRIENILSRLIGEDVEIAVELSDDPLTILADSLQIEQVLMNLAANARDAMPEGGSLSIRTEVVTLDSATAEEFSLKEPGRYACFSVRDNGVGIARDEIGSIFEPFYTTKELGKGTGLGLSIVYGIVKQHEGHVTVTSTSKEGTEFRIYLPLIALPAEEKKQAPHSPGKGGRETVLLAEDEEVVRKTMKNILEDAGYTVIEAADGEEAVKRFAENSEDVRIIVLDVIMPLKNGKETYKQIRKLNPDMKALFTSGYSADIISKRGVVEDGICFIPKSVNPVDLLSKIREILDT